MSWDAPQKLYAHKPEMDKDLTTERGKKNLHDSFFCILQVALIFRVYSSVVPFLQIQ